MYTIDFREFKLQFGPAYYIILFSEAKVKNNPYAPYTEKGIGICCMREVVAIFIFF